MVLTTIYLLVLFFLCFLYVLNLFLRGEWKQQQGVILGSLVFCMTAASFFIFGWKMGCLMLLAPFLFVAIGRPVAAPLANRLLGYRTGMEAHPPIGTTLDRLMEGKLSLGQCFQILDQEKKNRAQRFEGLLNAPRFRKTVALQSLTVEMMEDHFRFLLECYLNDIMWEILEDPDELEQLIELRSQGKDAHVVQSHFRCWSQ